MCRFCTPRMSGHKPSQPFHTATCDCKSIECNLIDIPAFYPSPTTPHSNQCAPHLLNLRLPHIPSMISQSRVCPAQAASPCLSVTGSWVQRRVRTHCTAAVRSGQIADHVPALGRAGGTRIRVVPVLRPPHLGPTPVRAGPPYPWVRRASPIVVCRRKSTPSTDMVG
jgi:hypothetical protein